MAAGNPYLDDAPASGGNPYLDDTPVPAAAPAKPPATPQQWGFREYATDGFRSLLNGIGKGAAGVVGLPADALRLGQAGLDYSQSIGQGRPYEAVAAENRNRGAVGIPDVVAQRVAQGARTLGSENIQANLPTQYEPQSRAGKVISEAANFATQGAALPFGMARGAATGVGALAGVGSEVAGQATEGTVAEPYARLAGAIAAPLGVATAQIPGAAQRAVVREASAVPQAELSQILSQAQGLLDTAAQNGTKLSAFQAIDQASGGRMNLSEIQRQAEGMGRLRGFFADTGDTNREAAGRQFARVGEEGDSALGGRVAQAADVAIQRTPEGARLNQAQAALGPRVEAREAGEAMQAGLGQTRAEREAARSAAADPLYDAARNAPERIGVDRYVDVERPGDFGLVTRDGDPAARSRFSTEGPQLDPVASGMSGASGPRPESLARFVAKNGGVELLGGEARAADLHRYNIPGVGKVAREDGKSIDSFWREKLTGEDGYFPGDTSKDIRDRLISALEEERAGRPVFRPQDQQVAERLGLTRSREADELAGRRSQAEGDLLRDAEREGLREADLTPEVRARAVDYLAGGYERDPLQAYERAANELREPLPRRPATTEERGPNVTEQVYAPRFGQVNPQIAIDHVERAIELGAKGEHASKLAQIRGMLNNSRGETDLTTRGLMGADRAIASLVSQARTSGDGPLVRELMQAKAALRDAMETAPEVAQANRTFERLSRPLDNFDGSRPAGRITERDEFGRRNVLDPEFVPDQIRGSTAAREFNEAATPAAREAYRGRLTTQIMDEAGGREATGEAIRAALTKNADLLREHPGVVARLTARAEAEEGMTAVRNGPLGRLVDENQTASEAASKLFPTGQAAQDFSPEEVGRAVGALAAENPRAAGSLVRTRLQGAFDSVARDVNTAGGQMGAAKFRNAIYGNTREAEHIRAAVRALPDGETVLQGLDRLFDVFQAQGLRQNVGSKTAYNQAFLEEASRGGKLEGAAKAAVNPIKLPSRFGKMIEEWRLGRNMDQIAAMVTSPDARAAFRGLLKSGDISGPVGRLATIAARSQAQAPLQITVQPRGQDR